MNTIIQEFTLNNGLSVPKIGFGTYKATAGNDASVISDAIREGYRLFDSASFYDNEQFIGEAVSQSGIPRNQFLLTSKVWKAEMGYGNTLKAFVQSQQKMQSETIDLYLIHWPRPNLNDAWQPLVQETWKAMEELYDAKKVSAIGVCNFLSHHLEVLLDKAIIKPAVNQIEFHPGYTQMETVRFSQALGIQVEAWSPLGRAKMLEDALLKEIAEKYGKTVAQICIRFAIQLDVLPLVKSSSPDRMRENLDVFNFTIADEDMEKMLGMPVTGWSGEHPDKERVEV